MPTETPAELLAATPIFARLSRKSVERLAAHCVPRAYAPGDVVLEEGAVGLGMILVVSGRVEVSKGRGPQRVRLASVGRGEILGEMALLDDQPRSATAVALEPTEALLLTRDAFRAAVEKDPEILWCIVPTLTERLRNLQTRATSAAEPRTLLPASATTPASEPAANAEATDKESSKSKKDLDESLAKVLRAQYAIARSGLVGVSGMLRATEEFLRTLDRETQISAGKDVRDVLDQMPDGLASAARAALTASEDVAADMLETYRQHTKTH